MDTQNGLIMVGMSILGQLPMLGLLVIGIILSLKHWSDYQKVSVLALIGFVTLILQIIIFSFVNVLLPQFLREKGSSTAEIGLYFSILGVVRSFLGAASWSLIVAAIFTQRYKK